MVTFEELDEFFRKRGDGRVTDFISQLVEAIEDAGYVIASFRIDMGSDPDNLAIASMSLRFGQGCEWRNTVSVETDFTSEPWTTTFRDNREVSHLRIESTCKCSQSSVVREAILNFYKYWFVDVKAEP